MFKKIKISKFNKGIYSVSAEMADGLKIFRTYFAKSAAEARELLEKEYGYGGN